MATVADKLVKAVRGAARHNPDIEVPPACILWPDSDWQWEAVIPALQAEMPELLVLGDYAPEQRRGPAIWLRCVIARTLQENVVPKGVTPVLYLPGISLTDLRAVSECPESLVPLAELQYRGSLWSQVNAKDWTVYAFLKSEQGGLGLDVPRDNATGNALLLALPQLLDDQLEALQGRRLDADYFNTLLTGGDPVKDLLNWLDSPEAFQAKKDDTGWKAFAQVCRSQFVFDPDKDGALAGLQRLAEHTGAWKQAWARFCEAPQRYPNIPQRLQQVTPAQFDMYATAEELEGWPQYNQEQEERLFSDLRRLADMPTHQARKALLGLEKEHAVRRAWVWAEIGLSPLARALAPLAELAKVTESGLDVGEVEDMAAAYRRSGWRADDAVLSALNEVDSDRTLDAVSTAIRALYLPWSENAARHLQSRWDPQTHGRRRRQGRSGGSDSVECVLFVDGLRFDCAMRLQALLEDQGLTVEDRPEWSALPSVTGTGKYAVAPVINEQDTEDASAPYDFTPITPHLFKKLLKQGGWQILDKRQVLSLHDGKIDTTKNTWCEFGDIDHEGHDRGWRLAQHVNSLLGEVAQRIQALLAAGWSQVRVVTDHGWLLMPGELPKTHLPASLADTKWGRCAVVKDGAQTDERLYPWYWDPNRHFALADGISCFKAGEEYAHGGLTLQEAYICELVVTGHGGGASMVTIGEMVWKGLRCSVELDGGDGLTLDVRMHAGDPESSVVLKPKPFKDGGVASVVVPDEDLEGREAVAVVLDADGNLVTQRTTRIGEE